MTPDQARERAWDDRLRESPNLPYLTTEETEFHAGFDAALAYVWEVCGAPSEPGWYAIWWQRQWVPVLVRHAGFSRHSLELADGGIMDRKGVAHQLGDLRLEHWRRLRLPPPPEGE